MDKQSYKVLVAATGSVAALKLPLIVESLIKLPVNDHCTFEVRVLVTEHAKHFFKMSEIPSHVQVYDDNEEWKVWSGRGDPVLHIELGKWADLMLIAPLDANTLAKMAQGICDNLITCTTRAWDMEKPLVFCPAMNTRMWNHPITYKQVQVLKDWGHIEIPPISKKLICGDTGLGAMAEVDDIVKKICNIAANQMLIRSNCNKLRQT